MRPFTEQSGLVNGGDGSKPASSSKIIKRYANRKLYDTEESRYITLDEIGQMIREGVDVQIVDNRSKGDLTSVTLAQIIFEEEKKQNHMPLGVLREIIRSGGATVTDFIQNAVGNRVVSLRDRLRRDGGGDGFDSPQASLADWQRRVDDPRAQGGGHDDVSSVSGQGDHGPHTKARRARNAAGAAGAARGRRRRGSSCARTAPLMRREASSAHGSGSSARGRRPIARGSGSISAGSELIARGSGPNTRGSGRCQARRCRCLRRSGLCQACSIRCPAPSHRCPRSSVRCHEATARRSHASPSTWLEFPARCL